MYQQLIDNFIQRETLPPAYRRDIENWFLPLALELEARARQQAPATLLVGIHGAQGTGKSTLARLLVQLLHERQCRAVALSIDDFYLGKADRLRLGEEIHPLLVTRGVPGTHNVDLLLAKLDELAAAGSSDHVHLPGFDKATDDSLPAARCQKVSGPVDIIFLEGWCVGLKPQSAADLTQPCNALELVEDMDGGWRRHVNAQLAGPYQDVFTRCELLVMLKAPGFEQVGEWRNLQEQKLEMTATRQTSVMNAPQLDRFIQHFERLTRHALATLPQDADIVFELNREHQVVRRLSSRNNAG